VIKAQLDQSIAQLDLTEIKLQRINIRAPFDGVLLSGDLSQKLGSVIDQGEVLFEIAPLTGYRLILQVNESEIAHVKEGQRGVLVLSALPDSFGFAVRKITPISTPIEGKNCFRVEANLDKVSGKFRPGMEGIGKISVDRRKLISIWTLKLRNWLRLWVWSWWP
jgi:multidrug efflux pump subunit AcrA (membrane-fusion protein)